MKKQFICRKCGYKNEFDTDEAKTQLLENLQNHPRPSVYIIACSSCSTENRITV